MSSANSLVALNIHLSFHRFLLEHPFFAKHKELKEVDGGKDEKFFISTRRHHNNSEATERLSAWMFSQFIKVGSL